MIAANRAGAGLHARLASGRVANDVEYAATCAGTTAQDAARAIRRTLGIFFRARTHLPPRQNPSDAPSLPHTSALLARPPIDRRGEVDFAGARRSAPAGACHHWVGRRILRIPL